MSRLPRLDQADGLRRLFASRRAARVVPVVSNPHVAFGGVMLERLCTAFNERGLRVLVADAGERAGAPGEMALVDLAQCVQRLAPQVAYLPARDLPVRFVDAAGSTRAFVERAAEAAPGCDVVIVQASASDLCRMFGGARRARLLADDGARPARLFADGDGARRAQLRADGGGARREWSFAAADADIVRSGRSLDADLDADGRALDDADAPCPIVLADDRPASVTHAYASMKLLAKRAGLVVADLLLGAAPGSPRAERIAAKLAGCADAFYAGVLRDWARIDPASDPCEPPSAALRRLVAARLDDRRGPAVAAGVAFGVADASIASSAAAATAARAAVAGTP